MIDQKKFFLSSHDYIQSPEPRECIIIGACLVREYGERLLRVLVSPPLPGNLVGESYEIRSLLLGQIDMNLQLSDIGSRPFMVDIFVAKAETTLDNCTASDIEKIGCGLIHLTMGDAIAASPLNDKN